MVEELKRPRVPQWSNFEPLPLSTDEWGPGQLLLASRPKAKNLFVFTRRLFKTIAEVVPGKRPIREVEALEFPRGELWTLRIPCSGLWDRIEAVSLNNLTEKQFCWYEELRAKIVPPNDNEV